MLKAQDVLRQVSPLRFAGQWCVTAVCVLLSDDVPSQCGNYEVEEMEGCDGGVEGMVDNDPCCDTGCHLRPTANCR